MGGLARVADSPSPRPNAVFLEIFGNGGALFFNYERIVSQGIGVRVGVANWSAQDFEKTTVTTVPLTLSYLFGARVGGGVLGSNSGRGLTFSDLWR
jgi:hypothetical protein